MVFDFQTLALPAAIMGRKDVLGAAETGSGKTLAFGIPIVHRILDYRDRLAKGVVIVWYELFGSILIVYGE
jgi:superfamily II DNA/RNA helicase